MRASSTFSFRVDDRMLPRSFHSFSVERKRKSFAILNFYEHGKCVSLSSFIFPRYFF